jgi:hypothetical protein
MLTEKNVADFQISSMCSSCASCVGVSFTGGEILVTNTTTNDAPVAKFTQDEWKAFIAGVKNGEFDI